MFVKETTCCGISTFFRLHFLCYPSPTCLLSSARRPIYAYFPSSRSLVSLHVVIYGCSLCHTNTFSIWCFQAFALSASDFYNALHPAPVTRHSAMEFGPPPRCTNLAKLPNDMLFEIFGRCLADDNNSFSSLSSSCKEFYKLLHEPDVIRSLRFDCTPKTVLSVTSSNCSLLMQSADAGNKLARYLLGLHLTFNEGQPHKGITYLKGLEKHETWIGRYVHAMAQLKVGEAQAAAHALQALPQDMDFDKSDLLDCRELFRMILRPGRHNDLGITNLCIYSGSGHWQFKTDAEITGPKEFLIDCPFCLIDVETYKLKHDIE